MYRLQKGSGDSGSIIIVFGACCVLSVLLIIFNWMGDSMQERRDSRSQNRDTEETVLINEPFGYEVVYSRSLTGFKHD